MDDPTNGPKIDWEALKADLHQARQARIDAQAAGSEVAELIWAVQHFEPGKQRMLFMVDVGYRVPCHLAADGDFVDDQRLRGTH